MKKVFNLLGLSKRAGKLVTGEDLILKEIRNKTAKLIIVSEDCGKNTSKNLYNKAKYYEIEVIIAFSSEQISAAIGQQNRVAIAITDLGFSQKIKELINKGGYIDDRKN